MPIWPRSCAPAPSRGAGRRARGWKLARITSSAMLCSDGILGSTSLPAPCPARPSRRVCAGDCLPDRLRRAGHAGPDPPHRAGCGDGSLPGWHPCRQGWPAAGPPPFARAGDCRHQPPSCSTGGNSRRGLGAAAAACLLGVMDRPAPLACAAGRWCRRFLSNRTARPPDLTVDLPTAPMPVTRRRS